MNRFFIAAPLWNGLYTVTVLNAGSRSSWFAPILTPDAILKHQFIYRDFVGINPARSSTFAFSPANH